jgi:hypothetical protein
MSYYLISGTRSILENNKISLINMEVIYLASIWVTFQTVQ